ncbi:hypothetical protein CsSME_00036340 [Camellia sinensis var. sinensis]
MEVWSCPTIPTLQRPWWWRWISIGGEEERRRKREFCSSVFSALLRYLFYAFFSFFFAVVGTTIGAMTGAVFGMKSERKIGLVHGAAVGAFTGASFFLHAVNASFAFWISFHDDEPPSFHLLIEVITSLLKPTLVYLGEEFGPGMHGPVRNPTEREAMLYIEVQCLISSQRLKSHTRISMTLQEIESPAQFALSFGMMTWGGIEREGDCY